MDIRIAPKPSDESPCRARVSTQTALVHFNSIAYARMYLNHPGSLPAMAKVYIAWVDANFEPVFTQQRAEDIRTGQTYVMEVSDVDAVEDGEPFSSIDTAVFVDVQPDDAGREVVLVDNNNRNGRVTRDMPVWMVEMIPRKTFK